MCLPQKVTGWGKTTQLISTVPLQALYFLKIKTLDQILGGGLDLGFFKPILNNAVNVAALQCTVSLFWIPISNLSFASSELKPKCIHLPQGKGGNPWLPISYQQFRKALPDGSQQTLSGKPPER